MTGVSFQLTCLAVICASVVVILVLMLRALLRIGHDVLKMRSSVEQINDRVRALCDGGREPLQFGKLLRKHPGPLVLRLVDKQTPDTGTDLGGSGR